METTTLKRDSMVFYRSFIEAVNCLPEAEQLQTYRAIVTYGLDGGELNLCGAKENV